MKVQQAPVVQKADNTVGFPITYPLDSDLTGGKHYPSFEQPGPEVV